MGARILVVGSTMIDLVAYAVRLPEAGETLIGDRFESGFGGKGANQAVMAARFGVPVAMVNAVGDDGYGASHIENFRAQGIDVSFMRTVPGSSGVAPIWVDGDGRNRIIVIPGANERTDPAVAADAVRAFSPTVVVGQFEIPQPTTLAAFRVARERGALTLLNPAPAAPIDPALLAVTDWLAPNETEFAAIFGGAAIGDGAEARIAAAAASSGVRLAVTLGERGVALAEPGGSVTIVPAPRVAATDTTGAGDAFVGAFAFGLGSGLAPASAARLAVAAASESVRRPGTQKSFLSAAEATSLAAPYLAGA
jgi:ribokinase